LTGGVGHDNLAHFYKYYFIPKCPKDWRFVPVSRTVGADRVVDEMLLCFAHDTEIDWMLPGTAPTGKYVEVLLVAIVKFRGSKLYHLLGSGLGSGADRPARSGPSAGGRRRPGAKPLDEKLPSTRLMEPWCDSEGKRAS